MKGVRLHAPRDLRLEDLPDPEPSTGEVVLAVRSAMTCGTDAKMFRRGHPALGPFPALLGHEFAGEIAGVGPGVDLPLGMKVFCANSAPCGICYQCQRNRFSLCEDLQYLFGGFSEYVRVPPRIVAGNLHPLPPSVPMEIAPIAEPLACVMHAVDSAEVVSGEVAVVIGAGPLGLMMCAALSDRGADVLALDPHEDRLARASRFGASQVELALRSTADVELVRRHTADRGAEHVFEVVGKEQAWELAIAMACPGGTVTLFGGCSWGSDIRVPTHRIHYEQVALRGTYHHTPHFVRMALDALAQDRHPWQQLCGPRIGLGELADALDGPGGVKYVVSPR